MSFLVLDLETGIREEHKRKGNPWYNPIIAIGYATAHNVFSEYYSDDNFKIGLEVLAETSLLIGHNIKYDLLYLWSFPVIQQYFQKGGKIWDTQLAEYILSGQQHKFPALRNIAVTKYGRPERSKQMEEYWAKNIDTKDIPRELVEEDVLNDVLDTKAIYLKQIESASNSGQLKLIQSQMDGLLATTDMEYNGLMVDRETLKLNQTELALEADTLKNEFITQAKSYFNNKDIDINSPAQIGLLFFGGEIKEVIKEPKKDMEGNLIVYKSGQNIGQIKFENKTITQEIKGLGLKPYRTSEKTGKPSTDDQTLQLIAKRIGTEAGKLASLLIKHRETGKQLGTYYEGVIPLIYPDNRIHHKLHHVKTDTGRLSSTDPNLQNQPSDYSKVKDHFVSRFPNGKLIGLDFSQLEICVQAGISKDRQYIQDIINGVDFHIKRLALKEHKPYEEVFKLYIEGDPKVKEERTKVKAFSFARAYGAGAKTIAEQTGMEEDEIKDLIQLEQEEYPQLFKYNQMLKNVVESNKKNGVGWYQSITGRKYFFKENEAPEWLKKKGKMNTFMPTQIVNYTVQGTATADIVIIMLGKLWRELIKLPSNDKPLLINTVHDDVLLDVPKDHIESTIDLLKKVINPREITKMLKEEFDVDWIVPIKIDIKQGVNWGNMK